MRARSTGWIAGWIAGWVGLAGCGPHAAALDLVDVTRADLVVAVEVAGELAAVDSTDIRPPVMPDNAMFKIRTLVDEGSTVAAGEPLVTFDSGELDHAIETAQQRIAEATTLIDQQRAQAALADSEATLKLAELDAAVRKAALAIDVPAELVASNRRHDDRLDAQQAGAELAFATQQAAHARHTSDADIQALGELRTSQQMQLARLQHELAQLVIASPRAGTIVYPAPGTMLAKSVAGEKRKAGDSVYVSEVVLQVVGLGAMVGKGEVDEVDLARLAVHAPATLRLDAMPDVELHGTLQSIAETVHPKSDADPSNVLGVAIAITADPAVALRPGMRFRGRIEAQRIAGVVQVPAEAVFVTPEGPSALRAVDDGVERVHLTLGRRSDAAIEVVAGLTPGDRVSRSDPDGAR